MEVQVIEAVKAVLTPWNIPFCIVNEAALNYYNVPRVLNSLEICVDEQSLPFAKSQLASYTDVFKPLTWPKDDDNNIYTDYKKPYPRFEAFIEGRTLNLIVFPDTFFYLKPLKDNIVQISKYPESKIKFSGQFDYSKDTAALSTIPVPRLASLLQGLAQRHFESKQPEYNMAMCTEQLVDGMNLDETWCLDHLDTTQHEELKFVLQFVKSKKMRISQFEPNNITCFVATEQEASELHMIPGYNELSWNRELRTQENRIKKPPFYPIRSIQVWFKSALFCIQSKILKCQRTLFHQPTLLPVTFQYMSDLHLEVGRFYTKFDIPRAAPYLVLAGDTGSLRDYTGLLDFLAIQCARFDRVFFVLGNHEFYGISREDGVNAVESLECEPRLLGKFSVLNRRRVDINRRVSILGCTLQSHITEESRLWVQMKVADFSSIKGWTVDDHNAEHFQDLKWLEQEVHKTSLEDCNRQLIIVTHHAPSFLNTSDPKYKSNPWGSAFCTELLASRVKSWHGSSNIRHWIFGHTHWNTEFKKHGIIVSSNQRGYPTLGYKQLSPKSWMSKFLNYFFPQSGQDFVVTKVAQV